SLTTYGAPNSSKARSASSADAHVRDRAVATPAEVMTSLAKVLEASSCAACWLGPKHAMPDARTASATPATSGASGPTITNSDRNLTASAATSCGASGSTAGRNATAATTRTTGARAPRGRG